MVFPFPKKVIYAYGEWNPSFSEMKGIEFISDFNEDTVSRENAEGALIILDDLSDQINNRLITNCFMKYSHHRVQSYIYIANNAFGKDMRTVNLNTQYLVLFKSPRDHDSIVTLGRQLYGPGYKMMQEAYIDAVSIPHSYLLVDSKPRTPEKLRLRSKIFPGETTIVYTKDGKK